MGDYWQRHVRPNYKEKFPKGISEGLLSFFQTCFGTNISGCTDYTRERTRLPIKSKGCGLREAVDGRHGQFVGAVLQITMPLMNKTDRDNYLIKGRLNIPVITNFFGEGSFYHPFGTPYEHLLTTIQPSSNIANGL